MVRRWESIGGFESRGRVIGLESFRKEGLLDSCFRKIFVGLVGKLDGGRGFIVMLG